MNNKNKTRIRYSKEFKRKALLEIAKGKSPVEVLKASEFDLSEVLQNDKKYAFKLIHKWKKEFYENNQIIQIFNSELDNETIFAEIKNLEDETDKDNIQELYKLFET